MPGTAFPKLANDHLTRNLAGNDVWAKPKDPYAAAAADAGGNKKLIVDSWASEPYQMAVLM